MKRTPLKRGNSTLKRSPLKKQSEKGKQKRLEDAAKTAEMQFVFLEIWYSLGLGQRVCYETGEKLYGEPLSAYFHHVLPKERFPQYTNSKWNIVLLTIEAHDQVEKDIDKSPRVKELYLTLLEQHRNNELKP